MMFAFLLFVVVLSTYVGCDIGRRRETFADGYRGYSFNPFTAVHIDGMPVQVQASEPVVQIPAPVSTVPSLFGPPSIAGTS